MNMLNQQDFDAMKRQGEMYQRIIERDMKLFAELAEKGELPDTVTHFETENGTKLRMLTGGMK